MKSLKFMNEWDIKLVNTNGLSCIDPDDVIVDIAVCGICGTDIGIINGAYPVAVPGVTLGHETSGIVSQIGSNVTRFKTGDRVVVNPTYACGYCRMCQTGNANHCQCKAGTEAGVSYDGAFAHQYRAKEDFLIKLDEHVSMEEAALTEPLSCTVTGVDKLAITHTNIRSCVIGAGTMGMLYAWTLYDRGLKPFIVERDLYRREFAQKTFPESDRIYADFDEAIEQEYGDSTAKIDLCVDTTGYLAERVFTQLAPGGKLLNVALKNKQASFSILQIADKSLSILGSIDSLNNSFVRAYEMIRDHRIPARKLVSHIFDYNDYKKAFRVVGCDLQEKRMIPMKEPNCKVMLRLSAFA